MTMQLKGIYHTTKDKKVGGAIRKLTSLARWYNAIEKSRFEHFGTVMRSVEQHRQYEPAGKLSQVPYSDSKLS
ncbi:hypothetical protein [Bacteroides acidifaciens]|uniref:hypothetical protein n=1 Tax=Bacteroides acidifaciens TaxID=85831 RepID=UPI003C6C9919